MGTGFQLNPSEQIYDLWSYQKAWQVAPMAAILSQPPPPVRPAKSSPEVRGICRNLFGSPKPGETNAILAKQQQINLEKLKTRYNIDLEEICNQEKQQEQQQISALNKSTTTTTTTAAAADKHFGASMPYARLQGIKRTYQVRKANTAISNSNVPKRTRDNLSSEMEAAKGRKEEEEEKVQQADEKGADKVAEVDEEEDKQRQQKEVQLAEEQEEEEEEDVEKGADKVEEVEDEEDKQRQ